MIRNFEQQSNGKVCSCSEHHGVGSVGPGDRAARYARMRDVMPGYFTQPMRNYLSSFEACHGKVLYIMNETGIASGEYVAKGQQLYTPECTTYRDSPMGITPDYRKRHEVKDWVK